MHVLTGMKVHHPHAARPMQKEAAIESATHGSLRVLARTCSEIRSAWDDAPNLLTIPGSLGFTSCVEFG
jgi:hypothetical protein